MAVPFERGALGHSDADVVCHAVTDAILGARGARRYRPSLSRQTTLSGRTPIQSICCARAVAIVSEAGFVVGNVDVTVVLERPKIKTYVESMRQVIADAVRVPIECVGIKGKTNEGVDAVGRGEAIAAHAMALLRRI